MVRPVAHYQTPTGAGEGGEIKISSILLQVVLGNIVNETTDAIVNGTSEDLDLSQGISKFFGDSKNQHSSYIFTFSLCFILFVLPD